jgi:hypothetical protein
MEQRPLRLGDVVDDYCPRERRITNHAIVALVNNEIRQTRCTACDSEHEYKEARAPRRRKKSPEAALYDEVLADVTGGQLVDGVPRPAAAAPPASVPAEQDGAEPVNGAEAPEKIVEAASGADADPEAVETAAEEAEDVAERPEDLSFHRRLIRATLPRSEDDEPPARPIPEFTMYQRQQRGGQNPRHGRGNHNQQGRHGFRHGQGEVNGNRDPGQGQGQGQPNGNRSRRGGRRRRSRKRSR